jgi:uncharacterized protein YcbX
MNTVTSICCYPIKGLTGEPLDSVTLSVDKPLPGDREYAFARAGVHFDPDSPKYLKKNNFLALVADEKLASLHTRIDRISHKLSISLNNIMLMVANLNNPAECEDVAEYFRDYLDIPLNSRPRLVRANEGTNSHSFSDVSDEAISLISLSSIREFGNRIGARIDPMRFRANICFENNNPWHEFDWINQNLRIGDVILHVFKRTQRCAATTVNPITGIRDINVPRALQVHYSHTDMGIYARVVESGIINIGDEIELISAKLY